MTDASATAKISTKFFLVDSMILAENTEELVRAPAGKRKRMLVDTTAATAGFGDTELVDEAETAATDDTSAFTLIVAESDVEAEQTHKARDKFIGCHERAFTLGDADAMLKAGEGECGAGEAKDAGPRGEAEVEPCGGGADAFVPGHGGHGGALMMAGKKHTLGTGTGDRGPQEVPIGEGNWLGDKVPEDNGVMFKERPEDGSGCLRVTVAVSDAQFVGSALLELTDDADGSRLGVVDDESNKDAELALVVFDSGTVDADGCCDPEEDTVGRSEY